MTISAGSIRVRRTLGAALGVLCIALGVVGVIVPGLPTMEFLLAASYLFARSSPELGEWLERNCWFGPSLRHFRETRGMPRRSKALALASMWTGTGTSIYVLSTVGAGMQLFVLAMSLAGTVTILFFVRTTTARQPLILS